MKTVNYGQWIIEVDVEKTKKYYEQYIIDDNQANRNFSQYCEKLSDEEKAFFHSFGINPVCCKIEHIGVSKKGDFPCGGKYIFFGKYVKKPRTGTVSVGSIFQREFDVAGPGISIYAGIFKFDFLSEPYELEEHDMEIPEGAQCIEFWCEDMKWLLNEPCEEIMYEEPKPWELGRIIGEKINRFKEKGVYIKETKENLERVFSELGIEYKVMTGKEVADHKKIWVYAFAPTDADMRDVKKKCLKDRGYMAYLWHMFSFEFLEADETLEANALFDDAGKERCILIENTCGTAYRLKNAERLTADVLNQFVDVTITSDDYVWTYSKTHEEMCGPYFYKR